MPMAWSHLHFQLSGRPVGLALLGIASSISSRCFGVIPVAAGTNANFSIALAYQANNFREPVEASID